ncbi:MAG: YbjQ family protein [Myxococcales bacterium]|nr:YbjQ family protein [Myxococcales bacterium]
MSDLIKAADGAVTGFRHGLPVTACERLTGREIVEDLGLVRGNSVRARHVGRDIMAAFRNMIGGEITDYTKMLAQSREQAIDRMVEQAVALGANAVVNVRFSTSSVMAGAAELLAYGTAVRLRAVGVETGSSE